MRDPTSLTVRRDRLRRLTPNEGVIEQVLVYAESPFRLDTLHAPVFPLPDEAHVSDWRRYSAEAGEGDHFAVLQRKLRRLNIPIREGVSNTDAYARLVRRGEPFEEQAFGESLFLAHPEGFRFYLHGHPAGTLPVLFTSFRTDFETLYRALAHRCEPVPVNPSVNAQMIAGFANWDRVGRCRREWEASRSPDASETGWSDEMSRLARAEPQRFYDRFILIGEAAYGSVSSRALGLDVGEDEWVQLSRTVRLEHEFTHYATKRLFGLMRQNLLDETVADFCGLTLALGRFRANWFLRCLGLGGWPHVDPNGRVHAYRAGLDANAFNLVCQLTVQAAARLEDIAARRYDCRRRGAFFLALASVSLDLLASEVAEPVFLQAYDLAMRLDPPAGTESRGTS